MRCPPFWLRDQTEVIVFLRPWRCGTVALSCGSHRRFACATFLQQAFRISACIVALCAGLALTMSSARAADPPHDEGPPEPSQYSAEELREVYKGLSRKLKEHADGLAPEDRDRFLRRYADNLKQLKEEMKKREAAGGGHPEMFRRTRPEPYRMDAALQEAYEYWSDWKNRKQDTCRRLFEDYLKECPDTPFRAEISFRIAQVYSTNINEAAGDRRDRELAETYYQKAHDLYGEQWSNLNMHAWATLVGYRKDVNEGKRYYDWLRRLLKEGSPEDLWPYAEMGQCLEGSSLEHSPSVREKKLAHMKAGLPATILITEKNIFHISGEADLEDLAKTYPDTELGRQARARLERIRAAVVRDALQDVLDPSAADPEPEPRTRSASVSAVESEPVPAETDETTSRTTMWRYPIALAVAGMIVLGLAWLVVRRRKSAKV